MTRRTRGGFTLIEMLVVVAIIAILIGMLLPGVQQVRETGNRTRCQANMKQLGTAVQHFHTNYGSLPTYNGIFPAVNNSTLQSANTKAVYGSWFVHLMPYLELPAPYNQIVSDVTKYSNTLSSVSFPATGTLVTPARSAVYDYSGSTNVPATYNQWMASRVWDDGTSTSTSGNGYSITRTPGWVPSQYPDPGTGQWVPPPRLVTPSQPAVWEPPGSGPVSGYVNILRNSATSSDAEGEGPEIRGMQYKILQCPSDRSVGSEVPAMQRGMTYNNTAKFGSTNYVANWNVFSQGDGIKGFTDLPGSFSRVKDGLANTVMMAEAYSWCDSIGRIAVLAYVPTSGTSLNGSVAGATVIRRGSHNFGLTFYTPNTTITANGVSVQVSGQYSNGYPSPDSQLTFPFQIRPVPKPVAQCPTGTECCNNLTVQTGHLAMNLLMADGSVRTVTKNLSLDTWRQLMLPADGGRLGSDW